jgi:hypothetical protein
MLVGWLSVAALLLVHAHGALWSWPSLDLYYDRADIPGVTLAAGVLPDGTVLDLPVSNAEDLAALVRVFACASAVGR